LQKNPSRGPLPEHRREPLPTGLDSPLEHLALRGEDAELALALVQINPDIVHGGWPPSLELCGIDRVHTRWGDSATTRSGWPAASSQLGKNRVTRPHIMPKSHQSRRKKGIKALAGNDRLDSQTSTGGRDRGLRHARA